jgi:hypothetical protein
MVPFYCLGIMHMLADQPCVTVTWACVAYVCTSCRKTLLNIVLLNAHFMIENTILLPFILCYVTTLELIVAEYLVF